MYGIPSKTGRRRLSLKTYSHAAYGALGNSHRLIATQQQGRWSQALAQSMLSSSQSPFPINVQRYTFLMFTV